MPGSGVDDDGDHCAAGRVVVDLGDPAAAEDDDDPTAGDVVDPSADPATLTTKRVAPAGVEASSTVPPMAATSCCAMASPRPVPILRPWWRREV